MVMIGKQRATAKEEEEEEEEEEEGREEEGLEGFDVLLCPVFATSAMPHDHSGTDISPFWRETGRTIYPYPSSIPIYPYPYLGTHTHTHTHTPTHHLYPYPSSIRSMFLSKSIVVVVHWTCSGHALDSEY